MNYVISEGRREEDGNVLVITLMILFAISVIGMTIASLSTMDLRISGNQRHDTRALYAAEAGLNEAIHRLTCVDPTIVTVGGWTGNMAIRDEEPYDPDWTVLLYLDSPGSVPAGGGSVHTTGTIQDLTGDVIEYSAPSGTDGVLTIRHKWSDLDGDHVRDPHEIVRYDPNVSPPENFVTGGPVEVVTVTGRSGMGQAVIRAEVAKQRAYVRTLGALYVDKAIKLTGSCAFCGYDHDYDTPAGTPISKPGSESSGSSGSSGSGSGSGMVLCDSYHLSGGHLPGVTTTGDEVKTHGSADIKGYPLPVDQSPSNPFYSLGETIGLPQQDVNRLLAGADNNKIVSPLNGITYIEGDATINSNLTGEGLIYITGDLHAAGNFVYKGLIYVEGDVHFTGSPWILGSMIVRGTSDFNFSAGNAAILYSSEALMKALDRVMPVIMLSWQDM